MAEFRHCPGGKPPYAKDLSIDYWLLEDAPSPVLVVRGADGREQEVAGIRRDGTLFLFPLSPSNEVTGSLSLDEGGCIQVVTEPRQ